MANSASPQAGGNGTNEYLTFRLGGEEYGIDILRVQEIRGYDAVTPIINTPAFIKGVVNLRGTIVPIVDLRIKFAVGQATYDQFTVVIILNIASRVVGVVVDSVSEVMELDPEQIRATPDLGSAVDTAYIRGLTSKDERMLIILDIEKLMTSRDMGLIDEDRLAA